MLMYNILFKHKTIFLLPYRYQYFSMWLFLDIHIREHSPPLGNVKNIVSSNSIDYRTDYSIINGNRLPKY